MSEYRKVQKKPEQYAKASEKAVKKMAPERKKTGSATRAKQTGTKQPGEKQTRAKQAGTARTGTAGTKRGTGSTRALRKIRRYTKRYGHLFLFPVVLIYYEAILRALCSSRSRGASFVFFAIAFGLLLGGVTTFFKRRVNRMITCICLYVLAVYFTVQCLIHSSFQVYMSLGNITTGAGDVMGGFGGTVVSTIFGGIPKILLFLWIPIVYAIFGKKYLPARRYYYRFGIFLIVISLILQGLTTLVVSHGRYAEDYGEGFSFDTATRTFGLLTSTRLSLKQDLGGKKKTASFSIQNRDAADGSGVSGDGTQNSGSGTANGTDTAGSAASGTSGTDASANGANGTAGTNGTATDNYGYNEMNLDFSKLAEETDDDDLKAIDEYVASLTPSKKNAYTGLFKGKNLILICAEAFSDAVINEELTPTLYRLQHNGIYFSDYYQPSWGGSTSTGEYSFVTGLVPQDGVDSMQEIRNNNNYFTLGNQLQRLNYYNIAYHNGDFNYYDRNLTHENLGYETFLGYMAGHSGEDGYDPSKALEDITGAWADDETTFDRTMDTYIDKTPFSIYYMTISGHAPYNSDSDKLDGTIDRVKAVYGDSLKETTEDYLAYQLHLEDALTTMVQKLEDAGIADDTVICLTADHYPYGLENSEAWGNSEDYVADLYGSDPEHAWDQDHNALILWSGCLENENKDMATEVSSPTFSLDVVPTLSNLFGLPYDSRLLVGRDVFSDQEPLVFWNSKKFVTVEGKYDIEEDEFYPNPGYERDDDYIDEILTEIKNKMSFSQAVVDNDYYGYLFGKDEDVGRAIHGESTEQDAAEAGLS